MVHCFPIKGRKRIGLCWKYKYLVWFRSASEKNFSLKLLSPPKAFERISCIDQYCSILVSIKRMMSPFPSPPKLLFWGKGTLLGVKPENTKA